MIKIQNDSIIIIFHVTNSLVKEGTKKEEMLTNRKGRSYKIQVDEYYTELSFRVAKK